MLRYLYASDLHRHPKLACTMFTDRADQFRRRLGWDVSVDQQGHERDEYDGLNPLYVIWEQPDGSHGGSMRFLPTTGPIMVNDHFGHLISGPVRSPRIWECTRFCLGPRSDRHVAAALMLGGGEIMANFGVEHFIGAFDARMERIYRVIGSSPEVIGSAGAGREKISVGLWHFDPAAQASIAARAKVPLELSRLWFERSFGAAPRSARCELRSA